MLSQGRLHDGQNHLFCDFKISGFKNWFIDVCMSAESGRVQDFPLTQMNNSRYYEKP